MLLDTKFLTFQNVHKLFSIIRCSFKLSLAWSISDPYFIIPPLFCADSSPVEIIFSLQSNFNNLVIFFSPYYSSVLNQMRGFFFFFPQGDLLSTLFKNESKFLYYRIELNSNQKRSEPHLKDGFVTEGLKGFLYELASP